MERDIEWYKNAAAEENEYVRVVIFKPGHPEQDEALEIAEHARDMARRSLGADDPAYAEATQNLGLYHVALGGDPGKAAEYFEEARATVGPYHPVLARSFYFLGLYYEGTGDLAEARTYYRESLDIMRREGHPDDPRVETVRAKLAGLGQATSDEP